jgi:hypothetical protein
MTSVPSGSTDAAEACTYRYWSLVEGLTGGSPPAGNDDAGGVMLETGGYLGTMAASLVGALLWTGGFAVGYACGLE